MIGMKQLYFFFANFFLFSTNADQMDHKTHFSVFLNLFLGELQEMVDIAGY